MYIRKERARNTMLAKSFSLLIRTITWESWSTRGENIMSLFDLHRHGRRFQFISHLKAQ